MSGKLTIRFATEQDIPAILSVFSVARQFMRAHGNETQWSGSYPGIDEIKKDIDVGACRILLYEGSVAGVFSFFLGEEPTYRTVYGGDWNHVGDYGFIHRIASAGICSGITSAAFDYALSFTDCLRIDTHRDNRPMQNALLRYGFRLCGIIHLQNGDERLAFEFKKDTL